MFKKVFVALLATALALPGAQAASGFSKKSSSSSTSTSSSSSRSTSSYNYKPAPSKPYSAPSKPAEPSRPKEPSKAYSSGYSYREPAYTPKPSTSPTPKPTDAGSKPKAADTPSSSWGQRAPANDASASSSGFGQSASPKPTTSTNKKLGAVAGATALGTALYAASANQEAVAAYQESQKPAAATSETTSAAPTAASPVTASKKTEVASAPVAAASPASVTEAKTEKAPAVQSQPQVVVIQEPRHRSSSNDDAYWYQRGRDSAQREQAAGAPVTVAPSAPVATHSVAPKPVVERAKPEPSSDGGSTLMMILVVFLMIVIVLSLGTGLLMAGNRKSKASSSAPKAQKPNYTL